MLCLLKKKFSSWWPPYKVKLVDIINRIGIFNAPHSITPLLTPTHGYGILL